VILEISDLIRTVLRKERENSPHIGVEVIRARYSLFKMENVALALGLFLGLCCLVKETSSTMSQDDA